MPRDEIVRILKSLNFGVTVKGDEITTVAPPYREDVESFPDLAEEVIRVYGYEHITPTLLKDASITDGGFTKAQKDENRVKHALCGMGYSEVMTYSFYSQKDVDALNLREGDYEGKVIKLENALSDNYEILRRTLVPSLLGVVSRNIKKGVTSGKIFEIARTYAPKELPITEFPEETKRLAVAVFGEGNDFFTIKGALAEIADRFGIEFNLDERADKTYLHSGVSAKIILNGKEIGAYGQVAYEVAEKYDIENKVFVAELDYDALNESFDKVFKFEPLPKFPCAERDLALVADENLTCAELTAAIKQAAKNNVKSVELFDVYSGGQIEKGKKSMAFKITFAPSGDAALTQEEVDGFVKRILGSLKHRLNVELR